MIITTNNQHPCTGGDSCNKSPRQWIRRLRVFGLTFAVSNGRLKRREVRHVGNKDKKAYNNMRRTLHDQQGGRCAICGKPFTTYHDMVAHHVLPFARFVEWRNDIRNLVLLCPRCHKDLHTNPYKNIRYIQAKAAELGINLKDYRDD